MLMTFLCGAFCQRIKLAEEMHEELVHESKVNLLTDLTTLERTIVAITIVAIVAVIIAIATAGAERAGQTATVASLSPPLDRVRRGTAPTEHRARAQGEPQRV